MEELEHDINSKKDINNILQCQINELNINP